VLIKFCTSKFIGTYNLSHVFQGLGSCKGSSPKGGYVKSRLKDKNYVFFINIVMGIYLIGFIHIYSHIYFLCMFIMQ